MNNIAIIGHNNALSKNLLELMSLRGYSKDNVKVFASNLSKDAQISFGDETLTISPIATFNHSEFAAVVCVSEGIMPQKQMLEIASSGLLVINATSCLNGLDNIPMVVGNINEGFSCPQNIINVPSPHVVQLLSAIAGLQKYKIKSVRVSSYVSADFEGQDGMTLLYNQTRRILMNDMISSGNNLFHKTLAFNVIPQVGTFIGEETSIEWLYNSQIKQVLGLDIKVHANCAVVPAFVGLGQFANIETTEEIDADMAKEDIKKTRGVLVVDRQEDGGYASLNDVQGESSVFVSRIRQDMTTENGISLWVCGDSYKISAQNILALLKQLLKKDR